MTNIIGQVAGGTISNGQGCYGASLLPDTFKKILLALAEDRCELSCTDIVWSLNFCNDPSFDISQEIFSIDVLRALKSSLKLCRKHVLRPLQLYGDQA